VNGAFKHGRYSCEAVAVRRLVSDSRRVAREALDTIEN
jgi:hypothetical protein